jgi:Plasmid pRiA4b ORF-3-like protein
MPKSGLTKVHEECLRHQTITDDQPGSVLRDFRMLVDFLRPEGVEAGGKYNLIPGRLIGELDRRLTRPLKLELKRPQIKSHPYIQGLNLLLRATGLSRVEQTGANARLVLDSPMLMQWDQLNPTEQYFNLLEAWLRIGRAEMFGEQYWARSELLLPCVQAWESTPAKGQRFNTKQPQFVFVRGISRDFYNLALLDLFGLMRVEQPPRPVAPWCPAALNRLPFGDAVFSLLTARLLDSFGVLYRMEQADGGGQDERDDQEENDDSEDAMRAPRFGVWQPLFQPYFPEWRQNLEIPIPEPREGTFVFRVSLGKVWRLIAMPADSTLDILVTMILRSVNFDRDHLYQFTYRDRMGSVVRAVHAIMDDGPCAEDVEIGTLPLEPGQSMELHYDFGDDWLFDVKLVRIDPPGAKRNAPKILEKHGKSPQQYPRWGS